MKIKIITLNLWGGRIYDKAVEFLKKENPDILLLQEVYNSSDPSLEPRFRAVEDISQSLSLSYYTYVPHLINEDVAGGTEWGSCIFSRFPLKAEKSVTIFGSYQKLSLSTVSNEEIKKLLRVLQHAVVEADNKKLNVYNLHGIWNTHGQDTPERLRMSEIIIEEVKDKQNVILAGDFNVNQGTQTVKNIATHLQNVFEDKIETTFNMRKKMGGGFSTAVVDRIFISRNIAIVDKYQPDVDASDHLPLVAVVDI